MEFLETLELSNETLSKLTLMQGGIAASIFALTFFLRKFVSRQILSAVGRLGKKDAKAPLHQKLIEVLTPPLSLFIMVFGFYVASHILNLPKDIGVILSSLTSSLTTFIFFWALHRIIVPFSFLFDKISGAFDAKLTNELRTFVINLCKSLVVLTGTLSILQIWGINVTAFLAGLGLVGMAVSLAGQDTIKHFFGSLAVLMDKTFQKGDWIKTSEVEGTVENVGLRTTVVRRFDKALVVVPNANLANTAVVNYSRMTSRRIFWRIGLTYDVTAAQLETIVKRIRTYLEENPNIESDSKKATTIINVDQFNDSSIDIFCYFFTKTIVWTEYMQVKEDCVLAFKRIVEEEGAKFAFPSRSLYVENAANAEQAADSLQVVNRDS